MTKFFLTIINYLSNLLRNIVSFLTLKSLKFFIILFTIIYLIIVIYLLYHLFKHYKEFVREDNMETITTLNRNVYELYNNSAINRNYNHPDIINMYRNNGYPHYGNVNNIPSEGHRLLDSFFYNKKVVEDTNRNRIINELLYNHVEGVTDITHNLLKITLKLTAPIIGACLAFGGIYLYESLTPILS